MIKLTITITTDSDGKITAPAQTSLLVDGSFHTIEVSAIWLAATDGLFRANLRDALKSACRERSVEIPSRLLA